MPISKQQDDHHEHHDHDQHRNNHSNHNNVEYRYSLEKNRDCTTTMNTTTDNRLESMFHQKKMIQSSSSSSSSRSLHAQFEIPKTLMRNDSISNDNNNTNDSEKSMKFLRGLYSTLPGIREKQQRRNTKRDDDDDDDDEEEITIVPIQYDNYVNKRQIISKNKTSIAGKRRNELLLDDASEIYDAIQAMKSEFEGLSSGDVEILLSGDEEENDDDDDDNDNDDDDDDNNDYDL